MLTNMCENDWHELDNDTKRRISHEQLDEHYDYLDRQKAELDKFVSDLSQNIDTKVGENIYTLRNAIECIQDENFWQSRIWPCSAPVAARLSIGEIFDEFETEEEESLIQELYASGELTQFHCIIQAAIKQLANVVLKTDY